MLQIDPHTILLKKYILISVLVMRLYPFTKNIYPL